MIMRVGWCRRNPFATFSASRYKYSHLESSRHIRLLRLRGHAENDLTQYEIIHVELDKAPAYVALSYVWGDPSLTHEIRINGRRLALTTSLHHALQDARSFYCETEQDPDNEWLHVWADAVCIDQKNTLEKNGQILLMNDIYKRAAYVVTYIGPEEENTRSAIELLLLLQNYYNSQDRDEHLDLRIVHGGRLEELGLPPAGDSKWAALRRLMSRPWSGRAWIVQESVLNENTILMCGGIIFSRWDVFYETVCLAMENKIPIESIIPTTSQEERIEQNSGIDRIYALGQLRAHLWSDGHLNKSLYQLLRSCHSFHSSDPRDKVYALLGIAKDCETLRIVPDYSRPVADVYLDTAMRLLQIYPTLDLFSSVKEHKTIDLPSWVPDWSTYSPTGNTNLLHHTKLLREGLYRANAGLPSDVQFDGDNSSITVTGGTIDKISIVIRDAIPPSRTYLSSNYKDNSRPPNMLLQLLELLEANAEDKTSRAYSGTGGVQEALWRTMIANVSHTHDEATPEYEQHFLAYLNIRSMTSVQTDNSGISSTTTTQRLAYEFGNAVDYTALGFAIGLSKTGYVGLVPAHSEPGDLVCVLRGGCVPYILRQGEGKTFTLVGNAYVHGLMKGEALTRNNLIDKFTII